MSLDRVLGDATAMLGRGDWRAAGSLGLRLVELAPGRPEPYFVVGVAALRLDQVDAATEYLRRAVLLGPDRAEAWTELARAYVTRGSMPEAVSAADRAMALSPDNGVLLDTLGVIYGRTTFHDKALQAFRRAVDAMPNNGQARFNLATALEFAGEIDAADVEFNACIEADPTEWRAYLFRSQLRRQSPTDNHMAHLRRVLQSTDDQVAHLYLNMALAKELEDQGDYEAAFRHMVAGKAAGGRGRGYSIERDRALFAAIRNCFPEPIENRPDGHETDEPIFVIGMPRSGTTLVERILSSHPAVHSAGELRNFVVALHRLVADTPDFLFDPTLPDRLGNIDWRSLGEEYLKSTRPATGHTLRFVDKLPHNFLYAGFIARALPNAKIICLRRDPMDTCLSNFRQVFALESPYFDYSFDLMDTGRYFIEFDRLIAHWGRVLQGRILELQYESLVGQQEHGTRTLLEFCGLPWDDACMRFETNAAPVATASAVQVRSGMNRDSVGRWRRYGADMDNLHRLLGDAGVLRSS